MGRDGQEVSVLCTYDSFASQSSISLVMANTLGLLKEDLGKISIQAYGGLIEMRGTAAFVQLKTKIPNLFQSLVPLCHLHGIVNMLSYTGSTEHMGELTMLLLAKIWLDISPKSFPRKVI